MNDGPIAWLDGTVPAGAPCPICGSAEATGFLVIDSGHTRPRRLRLARCGQCRSAFYEGDDVVIGYLNEDRDNAELGWRHYVEIGAGIDSLLRFALCTSPPAGASLLDVGCGFGFVVDYWRRVRGWPAVGLESANYGRIGREVLGADIHHQHLSECVAIKGRTFDIVLSAEVIEHVPNPSAFLAELRSVLAGDGVLVLTTPSSACLRPGGDVPTMLAALSPGLHYFLLSRQAFETLLKGAGFAHVRVVDRGERLIAVASGRPLGAPDFARLEHDDYLAYLAALSEIEDRSVRSGALYRLFKEAVNTRNFTQADVHFGALDVIARDHYGLDLSEPRAEDVLAHETWYSYARKFPAWYGPVLFYAAALMMNEGATERARGLLAAAVRILKHERRHWAWIAQESSSLIVPAEDNYYRLASRSPAGPGETGGPPRAKPPAGWRARQLRKCVRRSLKSLHGALWKIGIRIPRP